ncbi:hypothetical protein AC579_4634 [Pseudocercospora musae]|uniref:OPT family small oligopeptide transporter n=1 Tax=Pseudocercospora musae TaxID=113226 RepID=A0A139IB91_9PEZI|nr:hypothetical protein AC579_4634 [Pseudocercospora musae]
MSSHEQVLSEKHDHRDASSPAPAKDGHGFSAPVFEPKLETTVDETLKLEERLHNMTLERTIKIIKELLYMHETDPNFSGETLNQMKDFIANPPTTDIPEKNEMLRLMKLEALLAVENSPYAEVRANVDPTDDPNMPCSTLRAWCIGMVFAAFGTFIDTLFAFRYPSIAISANVAQLVAYPVGCFFARVLPRWSFTIFGQKFELNPGPFTRKEHMLITIMANVSFNAPYTFYIIPVQAMPQWFNMPFARNRGYQICISIAVNFFGLGMAGVLRRLLVFPSIAIWPANLPYVALIKAFHTETDEPVFGPFKRFYSWTRQKIFLWATLGMACWFMLPGYLFTALSIFSWITWISPNNITLDAVCGIAGGVGFNPWPSFDWNMFTGSGLSGLYLPTFAIANQIAGIVVAAFMILAIWFRNAWQTGFLPINSNGTFDNTGDSYNVTKVLDAGNLFNENRYEQYSQPWFSAGFIVYNIWCFASYSAVLSYVYLFHRKTIGRSFRGIWRQAFHKEPDTEIEEDIHWRLMQSYKEVPDWQYIALLLVPIAFGIAALKGWPTGVGVAPLFYGLIMPAIFIIPIGIIQAVTGIPLAINILADIVGGAINAGDANGLIYFKCWAYLSSWQALAFCQDLKMAHYLKIPQRVTFWAQIVGVFIFSIVSALQFNFILGIRDVCTSKAPFRMSCPYQKGYYTATVFWGVISPKKLFGPGQRYNMMLLGFPLGFVLVFFYWLARKMYPRSTFLRLVNPVIFCTGPVSFGAPYNLAFHLPNLYVNLVSFMYVRKRYLAFWSKWNYVLSAAFSCGIAIAALVIFFALELPKNGTLEVNWWGNSVGSKGCEGLGGCPRLKIAENGTFGPSSWSS